MELEPVTEARESQRYHGSAGGMAMATMSRSAMSDNVRRNLWRCQFVMFVSCGLERKRKRYVGIVGLMSAPALGGRREMLQRVKAWTWTQPFPDAVCRADTWR